MHSDPGIGPPGSNVGEYSVSELSRRIRHSVEAAFSHIRVIGEISSSKQAPSGHIYFSLKEGNDTLNAIVWSSTARRNPAIASVVLEEGCRVCLTGKLTTYAGTSRYQIIVSDAVRTGQGAILAEIEALKVRLRAEGIFDLQRDKSLPALPRHLGVVTSPSGSVIRDIMHRVADRCPLPVTIWPAAVQGGACPTDVVRGIEGFNTVPESGCFTRPDLIIVARGGGSFEDLLGFNDESVVRAAANSEIPLIAAIGHETDTTLIDSAATRSAPTPTAAVELALPVLADLRRRIQESRQIIIRNWCGDLKKSQQRVVDIGKRIPNTDSVLARETQHYDMLAERIPRSLGISLDTRRNGITLLNQRLHAPGLMTRLHERLAISRRQIRPEMIHRCLTGLQDILVQKTQDVNSAVETVMAQRSAHQGNLRRLLDTLGYRNTLRRGYAVIRENGTIRDSRSAVQDPSGLEIEFHDGRISLQDTAET